MSCVALVSLGFFVVATSSVMMVKSTCIFTLSTINVLATLSISLWTWWLLIVFLLGRTYEWGCSIPLFSSSSSSSSSLSTLSLLDRMERGRTSYPFSTITTTPTTITIPGGVPRRLSPLVEPFEHTNDTHITLPLLSSLSAICVTGGYLSTVALWFVLSALRWQTQSPIHPEIINSEDTIVFDIDSKPVRVPPCDTARDDALFEIHQVVMLLTIIFTTHDLRRLIHWRL